MPGRSREHPAGSTASGELFSLRGAGCWLHDRWALSLAPAGVSRSFPSILGTEARSACASPHADG